MTVFTVKVVREIADFHRYEEIQHNENSRVISFRNSTGNARINVYYTTGTVATCLNHPRSGEIQLFRRNQTTESLNEIFSNPRTHTGNGYHFEKNERNGQNTWTGTKIMDSGNTKKETKCDDSQRWLYVQAATNFCKQSQSPQITAVCELWNSLRFAADGGPTTREVFEALSPEDRKGLRFCEQYCGRPIAIRLSLPYSTCLRMKMYLLSLCQWIVFSNAPVLMALSFVAFTRKSLTSCRNS